MVLRDPKSMLYAHSQQLKALPRPVKVHGSAVSFREGHGPKKKDTDMVDRVGIGELKHRLSLADLLHVSLQQTPRNTAAEHCGDTE